MVKIESINTQSQKQTTFNRSKFVNLILAGIVATVAFNAVMYTDIAITGVPVDIVTILGKLAVGENEFTQTVGNAIHFANGIGLALFFGYVFFPISKRIMKGRLWFHGLVFAVMVTIVPAWFGLLPALGAGIAGLNIAPEVPAMTIIRHIVFGLVLGIILRSKMN